MFGVYACGFCELNVILWESPSHNPPLSAWGVWKGVIHFLSPLRSGGLRGFAWIRGLSWFRDLGFGCLARGEGEWADRPRLSLPSPEHVRANSPVEFTQDYLFPSPPIRWPSFRPTGRTSSRKSEGTGLTPEAVKELRRATDLALRATKHTARAVGRLMAGSAAERHLWLNLRGEPFHRYGARSDRKGVSARFKRALLTQNRHSHP